MNVHMQVFVLTSVFQFSAVHLGMELWRGMVTLRLTYCSRMVTTKGLDTLVCIVAIFCPHSLQANFPVKYFRAHIPPFLMLLISAVLKSKNFLELD